MDQAELVGRCGEVWHSDTMRAAAGETLIQH
jgi:hypothetical protein